MVPIPQYPLYTALAALTGGSECHYFLDEEKNWGVTLEELENRYTFAKRQGINPKLIVVINPGNPAGNILEPGNMAEIIKFSYDKKMAILADEVYQTNIYHPKKQFFSFKRVRAEMPHPYNNVELYSFHSTSKGLLGECGVRGGYLELCNV